MNAQERLKKAYEELREAQQEAQDERAHDFHAWCVEHFGRMPQPGDKLTYNVRYHPDNGVQPLLKCKDRKCSATVLDASKGNLPVFGYELSHISPSLCKDQYQVPCMALTFPKPREMKGYSIWSGYRGKYWLSKTHLKKFKLKD